MAIEQHSASFRDPSGFMFRRDGILYRQLNEEYAANYDLLMLSGLYDSLVSKGLLIAHEEVPASFMASGGSSSAYKFIKPALIPYISYPYEWCFSQLKDAALLTLRLQKSCLEHNMSLKDATAYNVQFVGGKPIFIDTLSFEKYKEGAPWIAYRQFCQHFLGPLALMSNCDVRLRELLKSNIDGIALDLVSKLLPRRTYLNYSLLSHIHLHASSQHRHRDAGREPAAIKAPPKMSKAMLLALIESLVSAVKKCRLRKFDTEWGDYYCDTNYSSEGMSAKESLVKSFVDKFVSESEDIHDIGANTGRFSHLVAGPSRYVLSHDIDELAVERHYLAIRENNVANVLPLVLDLNNPTPAIGWALQERESILERMDGDVVMALALIHHLAISNNIPLKKIAEFFHGFANKMIIEFVPKSDSQVQRLLATREDIFPNYNIEGFENAISGYFKVLTKENVASTKRTLYMLERV